MLRLLAVVFLIPPLASPNVHRLLRVLYTRMYVLSDRVQIAPPPLLLILGGSRPREIAAAKLTVSLPLLSSVRALLLSSGAADADEDGADDGQLMVFVTF